MCKKAVALLLILALVFSLGSTLGGFAATDVSYALTANADTPVRLTASTSGITAITAKKGSYLTFISDEGNGWYKVQYAGSAFGYVASSAVSKVSDSKPAFAKTTTYSLNVRASASTSSEKLTTLNRGTYFVVLSTSNGWCKILYDGVKIGYVSSEYVGYAGGEVSISMTDYEKKVAAAFANTALKEVGYKEGANNYSKYGEYFGKPNYYWCDAFVLWCACMTDKSLYGTAFPKLRGCTAIMNWYKDRSRFYYASSGYNPKCGDLIFFDHSGSGSSSNHMGLVYKADDTYVYTVEGNSSDSVRSKSYKRNNTYIIGYAFPNYSKATNLVTTTTTTTTTTTKTTTTTPAAGTKTGTVNTSTLNMRSGAGTSYSVVTTLSKGAVVTILGTSGSWYKIQTSAGKTGYVSTQYITVNNTTAATTTPKTTTTTKTTTTAVTSQNGYVNTSTLNMRSGAGTNYAVVSKLTQGTVVTFLGTSGSWYKIKTSDGKTGYVSSQYVTVKSAAPGTTTTTTPKTTTTTTAAAKTGVVNTSTLNMRRGAGTSYSVVTKISKGTVVTILGTSGSWYKVKLSDGKTGYVSQTYITV
ncbi:MAG: SH3 domain-containing protein [Clostridia bacterium]|nr:SH3 domain-containing protein [Clostridia bacterium]